MKIGNGPFTLAFDFFLREILNSHIRQKHIQEYSSTILGRLHGAFVFPNVTRSCHEKISREAKTSVASSVVVSWMDDIINQIILVYIELHHDWVISSYGSHCLDLYCYIRISTLGKIGCRTTAVYYLTQSKMCHVRQKTSVASVVVSL